MVKLYKWGFRIGKLHIVWYDMWLRKLAFEISWYE